MSEVSPISSSARPARPWRLAALLALVSIAGVAGPAVAQTPDDDERFTVIKAGKIITISGQEIRDGLIVLVNGKIRSVGRGIEYPLNARVIDARDRVVMPGLVDVGTRFGLPGYGRNGIFSQLTAADEFVWHAGMFDDLLDHGFTTIALVPAGGGIPGRALVTHTGGPAETRTLTSPGFIRIAAEKRVLRDALEKAKAEIEKVEKAKKDFEEKQKQEAAKKAAEAKAAPQSAPASAPASQPPASQPASAPASQPAFQPPPIDPAYQPLVDLIQKKDGVFAIIELNSPSDVLHTLQVLESFDIAHVFSLRNMPQSGFFEVASQLGEKKARLVMMPYADRMPSSVERILTIREMTKAGSTVAVTPPGDGLYERQIYLQRIAELVSEGWAREDALKAVTIEPMKVLGLDKRFGTIEKDKEADLIFLDGDPLAAGARVREVMIGGEIVHRVEGLE